MLSADSGVVTEMPGKDFGLVERTETKAEVSRRLEFGDRKELREAAEKLNGKPVLVNATSELVQVQVMTHRGDTTTRWELSPTILVTALKALDRK